MSRLVFNESRHTYALDGKWLPGASTVAKSGSRPDGLVRWAARSAAEYAAAHLDDVPVLGAPEWVETVAKASERNRDASMRAGKQLHSIAERLVYGDPVETADPDTGEAYDDDVVRMGEQVARFMDRWQVDPDATYVERPIFNETYLYAGTFDLLAVLRDRRRWLIDYKTGATGIWPETALQCTAYARATHVVVGERDYPMPTVDEVAALWVRPDAWELVPLRHDDATFSAFRALLHAYRWNGQRRNDIIGAALPVPEAVDS
jgi:hypothetical protein